MSGTTTISTGSLAGAAVKWPVSEGSRGAFIPWPREKDTLTLAHAGTGSPWAMVRSMAAIPLEKPVSNGFRVKKTFVPVEQKVKGAWSKGDVALIRLEMEASSDMTWVVVDDPIPGGATILNSGLGRSSAILARGEKNPRASFIERSFEAFRAYYEYVGRGRWTAEYTLRLNNSGRFMLPPTRVEALYAPEMLGEAPNAPLEVRD